MNSKNISTYRVKSADMHMYIACSAQTAYFFKNAQKGSCYTR